jgi:hypothetical protein
MASLRRYNEDLRAIGQALEVKGVSDFELYKGTAGYFIKDLRDPTSSFRSTIKNWLRGRRSGDLEPMTYGFQPKDIEELTKSGRSRRAQAGQLTQFRNLSNILRTIGAYLDSKEAELIELHKRPISITLAYRDKWGQEFREDRTVSSFYNFFLELYAKRR